MRKLFSRLFKNDAGSNALEYGVVAGLISVACITAAITLGPELTTIWGFVTGAVSTIPGV
jgi:pilus assembly protein Flp/PilA